MDKDSEHKICRLCYNKSVYSTTVATSDSHIEIYGTVGIVHNCAQLITDFLHLDVSQNDEYSKSVCLLCWNRLMAFNEFYMYVNEIQQEYLEEKYHVVKEENPYPPEPPTALNKSSAPSMSPTLQLQMENCASIKDEDGSPASQSLISTPFTLSVKSPTPPLRIVPSPSELVRPNHSNVIKNGDNGQTKENITVGKRELERLKLVPLKKLKQVVPKKSDADSAKSKAPPAVIAPSQVIIELSDATDSDSDNTPLAWFISKNSGTASVMQTKDGRNTIFPAHEMLEPELPDQIFVLVGANPDKNDSISIHRTNGISNNSQTNKELPIEFCDVVPVVAAEPLNVASIELSDSDHDDDLQTNKKLPAELCDVMSVVAAEPQIIDSIELGDRDHNSNDDCTLTPNNDESVDSSDMESATKFPARDFCFEDFAVKISKSVKSSARDPQNEDWPAHEVLETFPKTIVKNGKLVISTKMLFSIVSKFYKLECDMCPAGERPRFAYINGLFSHYRYKHNSTGYVRCCNMQLFEYGQIQMHLLQHIQPKAFICDVCNFKAESPKCLLSHRVVHATYLENVKLKCPISGCTNPEFANYSSLKRHLRWHERVRKLRTANECPFCGETYAVQLMLERHLLMVHNEIRCAMTCALCNEKFRTQCTYLMHMRGVHQLQYACNEHGCGANFTGPQDLEQHMRNFDSTKPLKCSYCALYFGTTACLVSHHRLQHPDAVQMFVNNEDRDDEYVMDRSEGVSLLGI